MVDVRMVPQMMTTSQAYFRHATSLALYRQIGGHREFWEEQWKPVAMQPLFERSRRGELGEFEYPFCKYLPLTEPVLEAGCGTGKYVCALQARRYNVEGIDYAAETIRRVQEADPSLCVRVGDIFAIDRPDEFYGAYISIGVLEHSFEGAQAGLIEAYRVLRLGGFALISVPYLNRPRKRVWRHAPIAASAELPGGLRFYQDHLDVNCFARQLGEAGFDVRELYPYALFGGLIRDWRIGRWLHGRSFFSWRVSQLVKRACRAAPWWVRWNFSHMMMFICQKPARPVRPL
jgi:SAM-dependent methyltransferase